ncbi:hypothetical protein [Bradyrhizobium elkanii]|uniref:hypothetical protein n=1 Tax=Bradyrhizobium elkanii TaxID=29448 RepID=UPI00155B2868|nr:hypothetical protein [Bradyrhizobium elkanii]MCP1932494.1 hypothetical protein [Bradyrhizobium elkanii]MCS3479579.1 hypothetical protein [Bradyrhizobium elkanii]MCS3576967.1 hypothetical protein [Bradyrhizobium elkanii]MCS3719844.1 hypothetical protein [Bradyrhizobium elkanii]MCS4004261.1 hypothetical protein [Bradyrhizobium elkanii USDA 61]
MNANNRDPFDTIVKNDFRTEEERRHDHDIQISALKEPQPARMERFDNYRIRRIEAYRAFELLEKIIDNLGVEDGTCLPLPDMPLPVTPSEAHKNELKNAATTLLRTILIWNDGNVSPSGLQRW